MNTLGYAWICLTHPPAFEPSVLVWLGGLAKWWILKWFASEIPVSGPVSGPSNRTQLGPVGGNPGIYSIWESGYDFVRTLRSRGVNFAGMQTASDFALQTRYRSEFPMESQFSHSHPGHFQIIPFVGNFGSQGNRASWGPKIEIFGSDQHCPSTQ